MDEATRTELFNLLGCADCKHHLDSEEDGCPFEDRCTQGELFVPGSFSTENKEDDTHEICSRF